MLVRGVLVVVVLVAALSLGLWWRTRNGRFVATRTGAADVGAGHGGLEGPDDVRVTTEEIGAPLGNGLTFLQLSSEVCAPCRRTAAVLADLAAQRPDLTHVEIDAADHLDLVRRLNVLHTPTVLLLDSHGTVLGRMSGGTTRAQAIDALDACPVAVGGR
ncbi:thioredoxin family protein [Cellulomonas hominis]